MASATSSARSIRKDIQELRNKSGPANFVCVAAHAWHTCSQPWTRNNNRPRLAVWGMRTVWPRAKPMRTAVAFCTGSGLQQPLLIQKKSCCSRQDGHHVVHVNFRCRSIVIAANDACGLCGLPLLSRPFYKFPCGHGFIADVLAVEVTDGTLLPATAAVLKSASIVPLAFARVVMRSPFLGCGFDTKCSNAGQKTPQACCKAAPGTH